MAKNTKQVGDEGEERAVLFFKEKHHQVLVQNYRYKRSEIDIISQKDNTIHFVEVKFRSNNKYGYPEDFVDNKKLDQIALAAENYVEELNWQGLIQFDIIAITKSRIAFFEDVY